MIAIIGAMEEEVAAILHYLEHVETKTIKNIVFHQGTMNGKAVVVFQSGIGLVMAAMSLTVCLDHFEISHVINIGTAGGFHPDQKVLDLVIPDRLTYHDFDITPFGNERNFGPKNRFIYQADETLIRAFKPLISHERVWYGPMVSGNVFVSSPKQIDEIMAHYPEAQCVDMEGTALANVASAVGLPFIIIRSLSDIVTHPDNSITFDEYLTKASTRSAQLCHDFVSRIL